MDWLSAGSFFSGGNTEGSHDLPGGTMTNNQRGTGRAGQGGGMKTEQVLKGFAIVVLDRGFVYVGQTEITDDWFVITGARNIRYWGTKEGLGELALKGPQKETKLDQVGVVRAPMRAVISVIDTSEALWT